jgi:hypothetical protein
MLVLFVSLAAVLIVKGTEQFSFLTLGDWGGAALEGGHYTKNVYDVAKQLGVSAENLKPKFIINTGDNIYWCGVKLVIYL